MSLKEKASEDGGRVLDRGAQEEGGRERGMEKPTARAFIYVCSVHVSRRKEKMMLGMQDFLADISQTELLLLHASIRETKKKKKRFIN